MDRDRGEARRTGLAALTQKAVPPKGTNVPLQIDIEPSDTKPLDISGIGLSQNQLKKLSLDLFCKSANCTVGQTKAFGLKASLYHVYTIGDYIFLDIGYHNKTNLSFTKELRKYTDSL